MLTCMPAFLLTCVLTGNILHLQLLSFLLCPLLVRVLCLVSSLSVAQMLFSVAVFSKRLLTNLNDKLMVVSVLLPRDK